MTKLGTLYVVATPIGNLEDISFRAVNILRKVDKIAAEDTRHAKILLNHYAITKPLISFHEFNEKEKSATLIKDLQAGNDIALISDAGTPLISDPGYPLLKALKKASLKTIPIPGPCAVIAALSIAGLPTDKFVFEGFLPSKRQACLQHLLSLQNEKRTLIFYESPKRLMITLKLVI